MCYPQPMASSPKVNISTEGRITKGTQNEVGNLSTSEMIRARYPTRTADQTTENHVRSNLI